MDEKIEELKRSDAFRRAGAEERAAMLHLVLIGAPTVEVRGNRLHLTGYAEGFLDGMEYFRTLGRAALCDGCERLHEDEEPFEKEGCLSCMRYFPDHYRPAAGGSGRKPS